MQDTKIVAITGSIGMGKSTVCDLVRLKGYSVYDCDKIVHKLYQEPNVLLKVCNLFPSVYQDGIISRKILGDIVFNDPEKKQMLEDLIFPFVKEEIINIKNNSCDNIIFFEVPLLYESNMADLFNYVIVVYCDEEKQIKRIINRNNISYNEAKKRISLQMDISEKIKLSDFTISNNDNNLNKLKEDIDNIINQII